MWSSPFHASVWEKSPGSSGGDTARIMPDRSKQVLSANSSGNERSREKRGKRTRVVAPELGRQEWNEGRGQGRRRWNTKAGATGAERKWSRRGRLGKQSRAGVRSTRPGPGRRQGCGGTRAGADGWERAPHAFQPFRLFKPVFYEGFL